MSATPIPPRLPLPPIASLPFHGQLLWWEPERGGGKVALEAAATQVDRTTESEQTLLIRTVSQPLSRKRKLLSWGIAGAASDTKTVSIHCSFARRQESLLGLG